MISSFVSRIKNFSVFHAGNVRLQKDKQNKRTDEDSLPNSPFCPASPLLYQLESHSFYTTEFSFFWASG